MTRDDMRRLGEFMHHAPNPEQAELVAHVVELAHAWEAGALGLDSIRQQCSGHERVQAMRYSALDSDELALLQRLVDALVADDEAEGRFTPPTVFHSENANGATGQSNVAIDRKLLTDAGLVGMTNYRGVRVWMLPLCWIRGEAQYPRVDLPPGEERRAAEQAIQIEYDAYRRDRKRGVVGAKPQTDDDA